MIIGYSEPTAAFPASAPTISDSIEALAQVVSELTKVSNEVADIAAKLASREQLALEEVDEVRFILVYLF